MTKELKTNKRGLVILTLTENHGSNMAGETAGFLPAVAEGLLRAKKAKLLGEAPAAEKSSKPAKAAKAAKVESPAADGEANAGDAGGQGTGGDAGAGADAGAGDGSELKTRQFVKATTGDAQ